VLFNVVNSDLEEGTKSGKKTMEVNKQAPLLSWHESKSFVMFFNLVLIKLYHHIITTATQACISSGKLFILNGNKC